MLLAAMGQDREKKDGEVVDFGTNTPEAIAKKCVEDLQASGCSVDSAKVIHWPADNYPTDREAGKEIVDDLLTGKRTNSF